MLVVPLLEVLPMAKLRLLTMEYCTIHSLELIQNNALIGLVQFSLEYPSCLCYLQWVCALEHTRRMEERDLTCVCALEVCSDNRISPAIFVSNKITESQTEWTVRWSLPTISVSGSDFTANQFWPCRTGNQQIRWTNQVFTWKVMIFTGAHMYLFIPKIHLASNNEILSVCLASSPRPDGNGRLLISDRHDSEETDLKANLTGGRRSVIE